MQHCRAFALLAMLLTQVGTAFAQEAVAIKFKERVEGEVLRVAKTETETFKIKVVDGAAKAVEQSDSITEIAEYQETILKREGKKPAAKMERTYSKAQIKKGDKTIASPLQGKTVIIDRKGDQYSFTYKGGAEVVGPAAAALVKEFGRKTESAVDLDKLILPEHPVKAGDAWKLAMQPILKELIKDNDMEVASAKAVGTGKLLKVYQRESKQFGAMQYQMEVPLIALGKGQDQMKFADGAKITLDLTLDACIDGSSEARTMKLKMNVAGNAMLAQRPTAVVSLRLLSEIQVTQTEPPQK